MRYLITGLILTITIPAVTFAENTAAGFGIVNYVGAELFLSAIVDNQLDEATYWEKAAADIFASTVVAGVGSIVLDKFEDESKADKIEERLIGVALSAGIDLAGRSIYYLIAHDQNR